MKPNFVLRLASFSMALAAASVASAAPLCRAESPRQAATVVELYTSEGCSSCPPADRWLSRRSADPSLVALAFHVDYWDRLGWKDRFGDAAYTRRQAQEQKTSGARFSYTPQVIVDGRDQPDWPAATLAKPASAALSPVGIRLEREGDRVEATVTPSSGAPARLAAFWAVTEDGHSSAVRAGENAGASLHHDRVVRLYRPVASWPVGGEAPQRLALDLAAAPSPDPAHPRHVALVVVDAATGRPVQAAQLDGC